MKPVLLLTFPEEMVCCEFIETFAVFQRIKQIFRVDSCKGNAVILFNSVFLQYYSPQAVFYQNNICEFCN